jgi:NADH-quinone oxidoreductase subunit N
LLIGVVCLDGQAVVYYLAAYLLMTVLSFAVLVAVSNQTGDNIEDFNGLSKRSPFLAFAMLIAMASLAGLPFTAGFLGKFYIFNAAIAHHQTTLIVIGVITVACGFYYYFKVVRAMYWEAPRGELAVPVSGVSRIAIAAMMAAIVVFGIYPQPIVNALRP